MRTNYNFSEEELLRLEESFQAEYEDQWNYEYQEPEGDIFTLKDFIEAETKPATKGQYIFDVKA